ncbi:MAG: hypothetical protein CM1200mP37_4650 [Chloroflexota bacterium]|nr:MAG: hypothetical protein CM1200mP37_4650 [Chloroflexota bacterium]
MDEVFSQTPKISDAFLRNTVAIIEVLKYRHIDRWGHIAEGFEVMTYQKNLYVKRLILPFAC